MKVGRISYAPIGIIRTPFTDPRDMPIQPVGAAGVKGTVELQPDLVEGLQDIEGFSHIILVYHFHKAAAPRLRVKPFMEEEERGIFATRGPSRPNPIGISVVVLESVEGSTLHFRGADMLDGTPLLDIKPHVPVFEASGDVRTGWLAGRADQARNRRSDGRFLANAASDATGRRVAPDSASAAPGMPGAGKA